MIGKRLINTGVAAADALVPSENFNTVLYTGNGGTQRIGGYINRGAVFNGSSSKITFGDSFDFSTESYSISCWVKLNSLSDTQCVFSQWSSTSTNRALLATINTSGNFAVIEGHGSSNNGSSNPSSTTTLTTNNWFHLVYTRSGAEGTIYVNGTEEDRNTLTNTINNSTADFQLGMQESSLKPFNGTIDQFRIFNKELSSSEVTTLYGETHASSTISTTDIFSDGSAVALYQLDGNANDTGGVSGKFGSAAIFNGSNSEISTEGEPIPATSNFSISFWINRNTSSDSDLFNQATSSGDIRTYFKLDSNGTFRVFSAGTNGSRIQVPNTTSAITNGQWEHIAIVRDGSNMTFYINGTGETETISGGTVGVGRGDMIIGSASASPDARIDDIRIYSDALTLTEVGYLYNNTTASIPTDNLEAYYKLDGDARDEQQLYDGTATNVSYAYDGTATNVTYQEATKFTPDLVWLKSRTNTTTGTKHNQLLDSIRGATYELHSDTTDANFQRTTGLTSFNSNGFTLGSNNSYNGNGDNFVAWCFKGGGTAVSNTDGGVTSQVSANTDAGFSIATWTYSSGTNTVGHGLSSAPELIIYKKRNATQVWLVFTTAIDGSLDYNYLNTDAFSNSSLSAPTNTVFSIDTGHTGDYVGYCFHSVDGYSKIGSYTGTGTTTTPIVETGFEPAFLMVKKTDTSGTNWVIWDNKRDTQNTRTTGLFPNSSSAEITAFDIDFLSNGFQLRDAETTLNASGGTYIYLAIAADPDTTTPTVENSFDVVTYTGDGTTSQIVDVDFKPDLVWVKARGLAQAPNIFDSIRGGELMRTSLTSASGGDYIDYIDDGFQFKVTDAGWNQSSQNYVAWCWKAGDHDDNLPQINTEGSIDSVVSVNAEAGFSIVKYTGNGTAGATVGHGLSSAPDLIIAKGLETASAYNWMVYASPATTSLGKTAEHGHAYLNLTNAYEEPIDPNIKSIWNDTAPTSTVFSISDNVNINANGAYIAYCFHSVSGYQKIGSYSGNGTDLSITGLGFQPRFLMLKRTDSTGNWVVFDNVRGEDEELYPNLSNAESNEPNRTSLDSDGFTVRSGRYNNSGSTFIYLAIK